MSHPPPGPPFPPGSKPQPVPLQHPHAPHPHPHPHQSFPPFPQLLHLRDISPPSRSRSILSTDTGGADDDLVAMSPEEEDGDDLAAAGESKDKKERKPHATRRRVVQSCSECRRRKIKCDKKFPCGPCILRSDQARCHEVGTAEKHVVPSSSYATTTELATLAHRVDALEAALTKSGALVPGDLETFLTQVRARVDALATPADAATSSPLPPPLSRSGPAAPAMRGPTDDDVSDTEGAALTLEHLAFGRSRVDGSHSLPHFGGRKVSSVSKPAPGGSYHLSRGMGESPTSIGGSPSNGTHAHSGQVGTPLSKPSMSSRYPLDQGLNLDERAARIGALADAMLPQDVFDIQTRQTHIIQSALTRALPSREHGELLVRAYMERVDWLHRLFHAPTFLRQCQDLWATPRERVVVDIAMPFVALYFTVCTLGLHFMDSDEVTKHFTPDEAQHLPDLWYSACRSAQWSNDFIGTHTIESLQGIILMSVLMNNRDRADAAWALLGAAIKMAQGLGLSRLGSEQQAVDGRDVPMWKGRWESVVQREVGRRIWWNLVFLDWALAPSYNFACCIQPDQIKTALPANVEDEDLVDGQPLRPQPVHVRTRMSFQLAKLKFAEISQRQIWQANNNNHPPYSFVLSVDRELRKAMLELPAFFQPDATRAAPTPTDPQALVEHYEKITLSLAIHSRMLRLHRPWLSRGYEDERFAYSKEQCIRAARASLRMMSDQTGVARFLEKWWIPLFYVTVSGMVVIIDLLKTPKKEMKSKPTDEKISEVRNALDQMRQIAETSIPARAAVKVMDGLLAEVEERRRPGTLGKRKVSEDDDDHNLQRAVKKLIHQAQLETASPGPGAGPGSAPSATSLASFTSPSSDPAANQPTPPAQPEPTPERPVFGAYPMPMPHLDALPALPPLAGGPAGAGFSGDPTVAPAQPANAWNFVLPTYDAPPFFDQAATAPLDPAIESMLASYFPQTPGHSGADQLGSAAAPQVPDDFLSRVFSFSWDTNTQQQQQQQQQQQGQLGQHAQHALAPPLLMAGAADPALGGMAPPPNGVGGDRDAFPFWEAGHGWMA
ncbi:hypothetical protein Q5752_005906 [Cryptotrichosporon argae]